MHYLILRLISFIWTLTARYGSYRTWRIVMYVTTNPTKVLSWIKGGQTFAAIAKRIFDILF
ncbi:hypothetical protein ACXA45_09220 [Neomicrococcus lactis]